MSDNPSDLASRAQAREEVAHLLYEYGIGDYPDEDPIANIATAILDELPRLAGLLGYVKADGEVWLVRRNGITYPNVFADEYAARLWARDFADQGAGCVFVRRCTADVEVVTDAEQG